MNLIPNTDLASTPQSMAPDNIGRMLGIVYFIYFFCGMTQCFETVFLPEFKQYFHLSYQQQMYTMFAKNMPFVLALVIGSLVARIGYRYSLTIAMLLYATGTLLLVAGLQAGHYGIVLLAFTTIGMGFTVQMVAGSPLLSALGSPDTSSSRLNFGSALGAIAQITAPAMLSFIIPAGALTVAAKLPYMRAIFLVLGVTLFVTAIVTVLAHDGTPGVSGDTTVRRSANDHQRGSIWSHPSLLLGAVTIFLVLGTEAGLFGFFRNYLENPSIAGLSSHQSQRLFTVYFALFALGRLSASWIQRRLSPLTHTAYSLVAALLLLVTIIVSKGTVAVGSVLAIGFIVSLLFPSLYAIAIAGMGDLTGPASGLLTLGFLGGAILPVLQGRLADSIGLQHSYAMGLFVYTFALAYVLWMISHKSERAAVFVSHQEAGHP